MIPLRAYFKRKSPHFAPENSVMLIFHLLREAQEDAKRARETTSFAQVNQEKQRVRQLH